MLVLDLVVECKEACLLAGLLFLGYDACDADGVAYVNGFEEFCVGLGEEEVLDDLRGVEEAEGDADG